MPDQEHDIVDVAAFTFYGTDAGGDALHRQEIFGRWHRQSQVWKLRQRSLNRLMPVRDKSLCCIIQPVRRKTVRLSDLPGDFANNASGLKNRINILRRGSRRECQNHNRTAEDTKLTMRVSAPETVRYFPKSFQYDLATRSD